MRIALIYLGRRGGGDTYSLEVAKKLAKKAEVLAIILRQNWNLEAWKKSGVSFIEVSTYRNAWEFIPSSLNFNKHLSLRRQIQYFHPDVLYYPMFHLWTPLINWMFPSLPKVLTIHDPVLHLGEHNIIVSLLQRIAIRQATRIIILSQIFIETMEDRGIPQKQIDVIPHGEFLYCGQPLLQTATSHKKTPPILLFFGRIFPYKGLEVLLKAFPLIKRKVPEARLLIVGPGNLSLYRQQLNKLKDVIIVNKWIKNEEIAFCFQQASVLVAPYIDASQSGVIPIAYAFRVPVITTNIGGLPEQVEDEKTGFLVNPKDVQGLTKACVRLLSNPSLREKFGVAGYQKSKTEWNWEGIADKVLMSCRQAKEDKRKK